MEVFKINKMIDVRQGKAWADYLSKLGWQSLRTSRGINVEIRKIIIGSLVKIQKPFPLDVADLTEIDKIAKENKALFVKIEPYVGQDLKVLDRAGYEISWFPMTPTSTYFIHLDLDETVLWNNVSHSGKYSITRASREGAFVEIFQKPEHKMIDGFYKILCETGQKQHFYVPPVEQIYAQADAFGDGGYLAVVYDGNKNLCGTKWFATCEESVLYVSGGTTESGRKNKAGYILLWKSFLFFKSKGFKLLDLEGKDDKRFPSFTKTWGGFSHFKEKFGGEEIEFPHPRIKYFNNVLKLGNRLIGSRL